MLKSILNISGTKKLEKSAQKSVHGGYHPPFCFSDDDCPGNQRCIGGWLCAL
ncbi:hypothetical protein [Kordia jejudonensis]|uniref:hypothetical protein n=1 Tax=Kordia jejudonensis TaxID=1348245 RepID=UPI0012E0381D|nr:hypothetical protein [Kordia jejudonensis]